MSITEQLKKYKLKDYNSVNISYKILSAKKLYNLLIQIKTIFGIDFKVTDVTKKIDTTNNVILVKQTKVKTTLSPKHTGLNNIFHTYELDTGFISYQKYNHKILDVINGSNNGYNYVISVENNELIPICESYKFYGYNYINYLFELENNVTISAEYHLSEHRLYKLTINIPIMEEKYITDDKLKYIDEIYDKISTIMNE